jgi:ribosomal RNA assembly protein
MIEAISIPKERIRKFGRLKARLEELTGVKIEVGREDYDTVSINDEDSLQVLLASKVVRAFGRGFDEETALNLLDDQYDLDLVEIKDYCGKSDKRIDVLRGRVIGTKGKTKAAIEKYSETKLSIYGKTVGIIGVWKNILIAKQAVEMILMGSKHTSVYRFLEEQKVKI